MAEKAPNRRGNYWLRDGDLTMHIQGRYDPETEALIVQVARLALAQYERDAQRKRLIATVRAIARVAPCIVRARRADPAMMTTCDACDRTLCGYCARSLSGEDVVCLDCYNAAIARVG